MNKKLRKLAALLLSVALVVTMIPMSAFASDTKNPYTRNFSSAVNVLRDSVCKRREEPLPSVCYISKEYYETTEQKSAYVHRIADELVKHTGNPFEGDYLNYIIESFKSNQFQFIKTQSECYTFTNFKCTFINSLEEEKNIESCINEFIESSHFNRVDREYYKAYEAYKFVTQNAGSSSFASLDSLEKSLKYAVLVYAACNSAGIDCRVVSSGSNYWNIIKVDDSWYNADASLDAGNTDFSYFLKSDSQMSNQKNSESKELAVCSSEFVYSYEPIESRINNVKSTGKLDITWNHLPDVKEYQVLRRTADTEYELYATVEHGYILDENVEVGTEYLYLIVPVMENGQTYQSEEKHRYADLPRPSISASKKNGKIKISWSSVTGAKKYYIYRSTKKSSGYSKIGTTTNKYYIDKKGKKGKKYYYKVVAGSGLEHGDSHESNIVSKRK